MRWLPRDPYRQAALLYALYGVVYLAGAIAELTPERRGTFFGFVPWWVFYVVGALFVLGLPVLVWRGIRWLTLLLALGPASKALWLFYQQGRHLAQGASLRPFDLVFLLVAVVAAAALWRAGRRRPVTRRGVATPD